MDEATRAQLNRDMAALADGDRKAFDAVYRVLWPLLLRFVGAVSGDRMMAEDMAQQALLKVFAKASSFDRGQDAVAWSLAIAFNEYRSHRRKAANRLAEHAEPLPAELGGDEDTPEAIAVREDLRAAAHMVLGRLRPQELEVVVAAICEGSRPALSPAAFRKRLQRALAKARLIWKTRYGDDHAG